MDRSNRVRIVRISFIIALAWIGGLVGCATQRVAPELVEGYVADKPPALQGQYREAIEGGQRDWVLNHMQAGLAAMEAGELAAAEESLDEALIGIETVYAESDEAKKALRAWREEGAKDFKGEPYERAMAFYYRGLLYLERGDYENARAAFRSAVLQDQLAEEEEFQADFALAHYLEGWASQCNGDIDLAEDAFAEAERLRPGLKRPNLGEDALVLAETGRGPQKRRDGPGGSWLRFDSGQVTDDQRVAVAQDDRRVDAFPVEDLYYQASTRGGRELEVILEGRAHFKEDMKTVGRGMVAVGAALVASSSQTEVALVGLGVMVVGVVVDVASNLLKPGADVRTWESLPAKVHVASVARRDGPVAVDFLDGSGRPLDGLSRSGRLADSGGACQLVWVRSGAAEGSLVARRPLGLEMAGL